MLQSDRSNITANILVPKLTCAINAVLGRRALLQGESDTLQQNHRVRPGSASAWRAANTELSPTIRRIASSPGLRCCHEPSDSRWIATWLGEHRRKSLVNGALPGLNQST